MLLLEIYNQQPEAYQDLSQDNSQLKLSDLRKTRLTLRQLNKLVAPSPGTEAPAGPSEEVLLLRDIRHSLKNRT